MTISEKLLDLAVAIQQVPAPTFDEAQRAELVRGLFEAEHLQDVAVDAAGNVRARLPGADSRHMLVVSAHLDTVFPPETNLSVTRTPGRIAGPGIGDNSMGVAALFGLVWLLRERGITLPGDLWLVANTGEEGLGDLRGMKAVCDHFRDLPRCYLVLEGMALGHVYHQSIGVRRYRVTLRVGGGHSWSDYGQPSAIHELADLIKRITDLRLPSSPRTTLNVGRIGGGTSINTLAPEAWMELDMRSESPEALARLVERVDGLIAAANRPSVHVTVETIGQRPAGCLPADHPLIRLGQNCLTMHGLGAALTSGSTDANIPLSRGYPAVVMGVTTGNGAHTTGEFIDTEPVERGMESLLSFIQRVSDVA